MTKPEFPDCPDCLKKGELIVMGKAGTAWSGNTKVQQFRCSKCKRRTIVNKEVK
ncbi:hypothetical protein LCGC14_1635300 [marine sediment metagenome]|uniref:Uncharacterized protein n=1 Tax=marine sediment metagenome TaxID=412755 RepID=A0A0F9I1L8_9ZZZZ